MIALQAELRRGERGYLAGLIGRSLRTLQVWAKRSPGGRLVGRPAHSPEARRAALWLIARRWRDVGRTAGWRELCRQLCGAVPVRLVQGLLSLLKRRWRARQRRRLAASRTSVSVPGGDVLWSQDSTQAGRGERGAAVHSEVVRDVGSLATLLLSAGPPSTGADVVAQLAELRRCRGSLPLVWSTDNGSTYCSEVVECFLERARVVHLRNEPHTPQHNSWAERAIGELKAEADLHAGTRLADADEALARLLAARQRLDTRRLRPRLGGRTAEQADRTDRCRYTAPDRERFYEDCQRARKEAAAGARTPRERRRAERHAILDALAQLNSNSTTRGDASPRAEKGEGIS